MYRNTTIVLIYHHYKLPTNPRMVKKILLGTAKNLYKSIPGRTGAILRAKVAQQHTNKGMSIVSEVFPLFCPTLVHHSILMGTSVQMITICNINPLEPSGYYMYHQP
jgi:hypothetical protein